MPKIDPDWNPLHFHYTKKKPPAFTVLNKILAYWLLSWAVNQYQTKLSYRNNEKAISYFCNAKHLAVVYKFMLKNQTISFDHGQCTYLPINKIFPPDPFSMYTNGWSALNDLMILALVTEAPLSIISGLQVER